MKHVDLHLGAANVRAYREMDVGKKNSAGLLLDVAIIVMFVLTCFVLYNAIVWYIWSK